MQRVQQSLLDIVHSIALIFEYVTDWNDFVQSSKDQDAVIRRLTIIGEATKRLSMEFRASHPHIPWKDMAGLRDVSVLVGISQQWQQRGSGRYLNSKTPSRMTSLIP